MRNILAFLRFVFLAPSDITSRHTQVGGKSWEA